MAGSNTPRQSRRNIPEGNISNQPEYRWGFYHIPPICTSSLSRAEYSTILREHETTRYSMDITRMHVGITNLQDLQIPETSRSSFY